MNNLNDIFSKLNELLINSRAKYSDFKVASILIDKEGKIFPGINFESSSYGATICAERNALGNALTNGVKENSIIEIHLTGKNDRDSNFFLWPCGICRQLLVEYADKNAVVYSHNLKTKQIKKYKLSDLLPEAFNEEVL